MFDKLPLAWIFGVCFVFGIATGVAFALRGRVRIAVILACLLLSGALSGVGVYAQFRPYSLEIRTGTFSSLLSGNPGKALIITNNDSRAAIIMSVLINNEFSVTRSLDSVPRGQPIDYPVTLLPSETLNLMVSESQLKSRLLPPSFDSLFPNEARMLNEGKKKPTEDTAPKNAPAEYDNEIDTLTIKTDIGVRLFEMAE